MPAWIPEAEPTGISRLDPGSMVGDAIGVFRTNLAEIRRNLRNSFWMSDLRWKIR
jgi:hypothetical protein